MESLIVFAIIAGSFTVVILPIVVLLIIVRRRYAELRDTIQRHWKPRSILLTNANCFGLESTGVKQWRGNGILVLTQSEIYFEMVIPKRSWTIPISSIQAIENPKSHLGKTHGVPLLKVTFRNQTGGTDSIAWWAPNTDTWTKTLQDMIQKRSF